MINPLWAIKLLGLWGRVKAFGRAVAHWIEDHPWQALCAILLALLAVSAWLIKDARGDEAKARAQAAALLAWQGQAQDATGRAAGIGRGRLSPAATLVQIGLLGEALSACKGAVQVQNRSIIDSANYSKAKVAEAERARAALVKAQAGQRAEVKRLQALAVGLDQSGAGDACRTPQEVMAWAAR